MISIHVPREGHDGIINRPQQTQIKFQSTCPARGTTLIRRIARISGNNFNPRAPRGARHFKPFCWPNGSHFNPRAPRGARRRPRQYHFSSAAISIHVPREGHDLTCPIAKLYFTIFQSTCPARGTTAPYVPSGTGRKISIHVPREGHDISQLYASWPRSRFQSTCPARGTTSSPSSHSRQRRFQSTCPARGTTKSGHIKHL